MIDHDITAALQDMQAEVLGAIATGLTRDLAISPVIIGADPVVGVEGMLMNLAEAFGMRYWVVSCPTLGDSRSASSDVLGRLKSQIPEGMGDLVEFESPSMVIMDNPLAWEGRIANIVGEHLHDAARGPVLMVMRCLPSETEMVAGLIESMTGIHRSHIPTGTPWVSREVIIARELACGAPSSVAESIAVSPKESVNKPVLIIGIMHVTDSRNGEYDIELLADEPYEHRVNLTIRAEPRQSADEFMDAMDPFFGRTIAVRAFRDRSGSLVCGSRDIEVVA